MFASAWTTFALFFRDNQEQTPLNQHNSCYSKCQEKCKSREAIRMKPTQTKARPPPSGRPGTPDHGSDEPSLFQITRRKTPMLNYQKLYFQSYFKMLPNGTETEVTRRECFAPAEEPTPANPYKQRWWYDPEASYAIRLPRNQ